MTHIVLAGDYRARAKKFVPPILDGLLYWGLFGTSADSSLKNYAPEGAASVLIGAPVFQDGYATFLPGTNMIQSMAAQTDSQTIVAIARPLSDNYTFIASNANGPTIAPPPSTTRGGSLRFEAGAGGDGKVSLAYNQSVKDGSNVDQEAAATRALASTVGAWTFVSGRCDAVTGIRSAKDWGTSLQQNATSGLTIDRGTNTFMIGGSVSSNTTLYQHAVDISVVGIYGRALSDQEQLQLSEWSKAYRQVVGLT